MTDKAKIISAKFKNLRRVLKAWHSTLSCLKTSIGNVKMVLSFLEILEECRDLSLLKQQRIYWKHRGTIKWVKFGDEDTKFFHANATIKLWKSLINSLLDT